MLSNPNARKPEYVTKLEDLKECFRNPDKTARHFVFCKLYSTDELTAYSTSPDAIITDNQTLHDRGLYVEGGCASLDLTALLLSVNEKLNSGVV